MLAAWWTNDGEDAWVPSGLDTASVTLTNVNDLWDIILVQMGFGYQRSYHYGGQHDMVNGGYFYLLNTADDSETRAADTFVVSGQGLLPEAETEGQVQEFNGLPSRYLLPMTNGNAAAYPVLANMMMTSTPSGAIGSWGPFHLYHYQPWAWYGTVAEVVASILLRLGLHQDYVDADSFDDAYDGQATDMGIYAPYVYVSRDFGRPVAELIKEVCRHSHDGLYYDMEGRLAMSSRTRPYTADPPDPASILAISHRFTDEHLVNTARFTYGQVCRTTVDDRTEPPTQISGVVEEENPDYVSMAEFEAGGQSRQSDTWSYSVTDSTSVSTYGEYPLGGERPEVDEDGNTTTVPVTHMRFFSSGAAAQGLASRVEKESGIKRELTVVQDFRGLDFDVGYVIEDVELTSDGDTISDMRCIIKEIDFNNLRVTSVFLETDVS